MKVGLGCCSLLTLGLVACAVNTGTVTVTGDNPTAMRTAPVGIATLVFMDLEAIRPDVLANAGATLPAGITANTAGGVTTYTFASFPAANTGMVNGTVTVTGTGIYNEAFALSVASAATATAPAGAQTWTYAGPQTVDVTGAYATVNAGATPLTITIADNITPANNRTFTFIPDLNESWTAGVNLTLSGQYSFNQTLPAANAETITCTMPVPLIWSDSKPVCNYPTSGTLTIALTSATANDSSTVVFGPNCGTITIDGATLNLGTAAN